MSKKPSNSTPSSSPLRRQAESQWRTEHAGRRAPSSPHDVPAALYELEVHQIELELQNEELRNAQMELIEARNRYQDLYDFAPVGYLTLDAHRVIREANLTAATLLGVERGRLLGMRMERFILKPSQDEFFLHLQSAREMGPGRSCTIGLRRQDRTEFFARLESTGFELPRPDGARYRIMLTDATALHAAEEALAQSERRFRAFTEQGSEYVTVVDASGDITYENPTAFRTLGYDAADLVGRNLFAFVHPDDLPAMRELFRKMVRNKGVTEAEVRAAPATALGAGCTWWPRTCLTTWPSAAS